MQMAAFAPSGICQGPPFTVKNKNQEILAQWDITMIILSMVYKKKSSASASDMRMSLSHHVSQKHHRAGQQLYDLPYKYLIHTQKWQIASLVYLIRSKLSE